MLKKILLGLGLAVATVAVVSYVLGNQHKKAIASLDD